MQSTRLQRSDITLLLQGAFVGIHGIGCIDGEHEFDIDIRFSSCSRSHSKRTCADPTQTQQSQAPPHRFATANAKSKAIEHVRFHPSVLGVAPEYWG